MRDRVNLIPDFTGPIETRLTPRFGAGEPVRLAVDAYFVIDDPLVLASIREGEERLRERCIAIDAWALPILDEHGIPHDDAAARCAINMQRTENVGVITETLTMSIDGKSVGQPLVIETTLTTSEP